MNLWLHLPRSVTAALLGLWLKRKDVVYLVDCSKDLQLAEVVKLYAFNKSWHDTYSAVEAQWYATRCNVKLGHAVKIAKLTSKMPLARFTHMAKSVLLEEGSNGYSHNFSTLIASHVLVICEDNLVSDALHIIPKMENLVKLSIKTMLPIHHHNEVVDLFTATGGRCSIRVEDSAGFFIDYDIDGKRCNQSINQGQLSLSHEHFIAIFNAISAGTLTDIELPTLCPAPQLCELLSSKHHKLKRFRVHPFHLHYFPYLTDLTGIQVWKHSQSKDFRNVRKLNVGGWLYQGWTLEFFSCSERDHRTIDVLNAMLSLPQQFPINRIRLRGDIYMPMASVDLLLTHHASSITSFQNWTIADNDYVTVAHPHIARTTELLRRCSNLRYYEHCCRWDEKSAVFAAILYALAEGRSANTLESFDWDQYDYLRCQPSFKCLRDCLPRLERLTSFRMDLNESSFAVLMAEMKMHRFEVEWNCVRTTFKKSAALPTM